MKNLIYYPTFEPKNDDWLKYALIYVDDFSPIIPDEGRQKLSVSFSRIKDETDIVNIINPVYEHATLASLDTVKELGIIQKNPDFYRDIFDVPNILRKFEDNNNWDYEIFEKKYNSSFREELIKRKYACESPKGILTSPQMANLFMTFLANRIAEDGSGNPITDDKKLDMLGKYIFLKNKNSTDEIQELAQIVIQSKLPKNIKEIPLEKFIEFRKKEEIQELRKNFNKSLENFYSSIEEENKDPNHFKKSLEEYEKLFSKEIILFFAAASVITFDAVTSIFGDQKLEIVKNLAKSLPLIKSVSSLRKSYKDDSEKLKSRKFLTEISRI